MVEEPLGKKAPYIGRSKIQPLQPKNTIPGTTGLFPGTTGLFRHYRTFPGVPGALNAFSLCAPRYQKAVLPDAGTTGPRYYRILVRYYRSSQNENSHNFCIRTPILIILGSFRRGQQPI